MDRIINEECIGTDLKHVNRADADTLYENYDSNEKLCAIGFLMKFLEKKEEDMKDTYIVCTCNGREKVIHYSEAVLIFEEMLSRVIDPARCGQVFT